MSKFPQPLSLIMTLSLLLFAMQQVRAEGTRVGKNLIVFYDFAELKGNVIEDRSGVGEPLNLIIERPQAVRHEPGKLTFLQHTIARSTGPAKKIYDALRRTHEITMEVWIQTDDLKQDGPARFLTMSRDSGSRNFTLGQEAGAVQGRLRTTSGTTNGMPSIESPATSLTRNLTHVIYTRSRSGATRLFVNSKSVAIGKSGGTMENLDANYRFALGNELSGDRGWLGTLQLAAVYNRALSGDEVLQNFKAGPAGGFELTGLNAPLTKNEMLFESRIAGLLTKHCLECHDTPNAKGGLDLSQQITATQGGDSGKAIVPGNLDESLLLHSIANNEMPKKRTPLTPKEKQALTDWIQGGANWTVKVIDPAIYGVHTNADEIWVRRLTVPEYISTVKHTLGVEISDRAHELLPPDLRADGFSNTAYNLSVDLKHIEAYQQLAQRIAEQVDTNAFLKQFTNRTSFGEKERRATVTNIAEWVLRGPVEERELSLFMGIYVAVAEADGSFRDSIPFILEAMLQSPRFMYLIENQRGDGSRTYLSSYELANRMSYMIWGGPPDRELLSAAKDGGILSSSVYDAQLQRMLTHPRAELHSIQFITEWLNLNHLDNLRPSRKAFPDWSSELTQDMKIETQEFFREVVWRQDKPMSSLLNTQVTFANAALARHYGLTPVAEDWQRYDLKAVPSRGGILTHGSVLTLGGDDASMVTRGLFVMHDFLRGVVKDPPPCVDTTPIASSKGTTQRSLAEMRIQNNACGGCHSKFEPLAFGLEKFNGIGVFIDTDEHGNRLREDGNILLPGTAEAVQYTTTKELMDLLADSERVQQTMVWKLTQFMLGRPLGPEDARAMEAIHQQSMEDRGTYSAMVRAIMNSDLVLKKRTEQ
ncbi:MAG: DUF1592 domain-containing protein [Planctomycetaceae bacterium]